MGLNPPAKTLAQNQFVLESSPEEVWDLLASVIFQQMPLERVDILDLDSFNAVLKWRPGFFNLPLDVRGELRDVSRPDSLGCSILIKMGPVKLGVTTSMTLREIEGGKVEVLCEAVEEGGSAFMGRIMRGQQRKFALKMFDSIEERLRQLCS